MGGFRGQRTVADRPGGRGLFSSGNARPEASEGRSAYARASRPRSVRDDRLAARAAKGDRQAFAELYRRHHQRLYRYSLTIVGDPEDAADALQTTMTRALAALERGESVRGVRPWLFRIAHNASIDLIRSRRARTPVEDVEEIESSPLTVPSAASEVQRRAELAQVVADIRGLPDRQGSALVMRELSELSYAEIAGALETSPLAARQLVHQARSLLHDNRDGRAMDCETVRQGLGDTDGKRPRDRKIRAHLARCEACTAFGQSIRRRRSALASLAPPLAPTAASDILGRLLESSSAPSTGAVAGGATAGVSKIAGASGLAKLGAAAAGTAAVAAAVGGAVVAGGSLLGGDDAVSGDRPVASAEALLRPDLPALRPLPTPGARSSEDEGRNGSADSDGSSGDGGGEVASLGDGGSDDAAPSAPTGPTGRGLPPVALDDADESGVDLAAVGGVVDERPGLPDVGDAVEVPDTREPPVEVPELPEPRVETPEEPVEVPGGSGEVVVEVPDVEVEVPQVEVPEAQAPASSVPATGSTGTVDAPVSGTGGTSVSQSSSSGPASAAPASSSASTGSGL